MRAVLVAWARALRSQLSPRIVLLSLLPLLLSVALWGGLMWLWLQPLVDYVQTLFMHYDGFGASNEVLARVGLGMLKTLVVPLVAMLLLLPLMIMTSLVFMGVAAMPAIARHLARRRFPDLEKKQGGSFLGSLGVNLGGLALFALLWVLSLPLYLFPPLALLAQVALWGWLSARVFGYDVLAEHASAEERATILRARRWPLLAIGMVCGLAGALPGIVWIGGALISMLLFPWLAIISVWLYLLIFIFSGLWFGYYCLQALSELRAGQGAGAPPAAA
jgi:hypothetical protein